MTFQRRAGETTVRKPFVRETKILPKFVTQLKDAQSLLGYAACGIRCYTCRAVLGEGGKSQ